MRWFLSFLRAWALFLAITGAVLSGLSLAALGLGCLADGGLLAWVMLAAPVAVLATGALAALEVYGNDLGDFGDGL